MPSSESCPIPGDWGKLGTSNLLMLIVFFPEFFIDSIC